MDLFTFPFIIFTVILIMIFLSLCKKEVEQEEPEQVIIEHLPKYELEAPPPNYDQI